MTAAGASRFFALPLAALFSLLASGCIDSDPLPKSRLQRLRTDQVPVGLSERAYELLDEKKDAPIGSQHRFRFRGKTYVGRIEQHYHAPDSGKRPVGHHTGVSILVEKPD